MLDAVIIDSSEIHQVGFSKYLERFEYFKHIYIVEDEKDLDKVLNIIDKGFFFIDNKQTKIDVEKLAEKLSNSSHKIVIFATHSNPEIPKSLSKLEIHGVLQKDKIEKELHDALIQIFDGTNYFSVDLLIYIARNRSIMENEPEYYRDFTEREIEVLNLLCKGYNRKEIAKILYITEKTVDKHKENMIKKSQTRNPVTLAIFAFKNKLVN